MLFVLVLVLVFVFVVLFFGLFCFEITYILTIFYSTKPVFFICNMCQAVEWGACYLDTIDWPHAESFLDQPTAERCVA